MTTNEHGVPAIVTAWAAAWNGTAPEALGALFAEDGTYTDQAVGVTMQGREQVTGWKARTDMLIADVVATVVTAYRSGEHVTIESVYAGHIKGAPKPFAVPMATTLLIADDKIASDKDYYNLSAVLAQSGLPLDWQPGQ